MNKNNSFENKTNRIINFYTFLDGMIANENINNIENYQFLFEEINVILKEFFESLSEIKKMNYISNENYFKIKEYLNKFLYLLEYLFKFGKFAERGSCFKEIFFEILNSLNIQKNKILFFTETTKEYLFAFNSNNDKFIKILNDIEVVYENLINSVEKNKKQKKTNKKIYSKLFSKILNKFNKMDPVFKIFILITIPYLIYLFSGVFANIVNELLILFIKHT